MSNNVGIVIVSHSPDVARGAADMVRQMVGDEVPCACTGGNPDGGLGTDPLKIRAAIESVWTDAGVAILVDLGGAETNARWRSRCSTRDRGARVRDLQRAGRRGRGDGGDRSRRRRDAGPGRATAEELSP